MSRFSYMRLASLELQNGFRRPHGTGQLMCITALLLLSSTAPAGAADPVEQLDLKLLLNVQKAALDKITSGRGKMNWKFSGPYHHADGPDGRTIQAVFAFDADKRRYDRTFTGIKIDPRREATNGKFAFLVFDKIDQTSDVPYAYIKTAAALGPGGEFDGENIDLKRMMQPLSASIEQILRVANAGLLTSKTTTDAGGLLRVHITSTSDPNGSLDLWFDPRLAYALVREQRDHKGRVLEDLRRQYVQRDGLWILSSMTRIRYRPESDQIDGKSEVHVELDELNKPIPETTFDLRGFGLPPRTYVVDEIAGVRYTLDPLQAIDKQVANIITVLNSPTPASNPATTKPSPSPTRPVAEPNPAAPDPDRNPPPSGNQAAPTSLWIAILVGLALCIGGIWKWTRSHPSTKNLDAT